MFFIIDFNASLLHTHHGGAIKSFAELLQNRDQKYEILLPIGSRLDLSEFDTTTNYCLIPGSHTVAFSLWAPSSWINSIIGKFYNYLPIQVRFFSFSYHFFLKLIQRLIILITYKNLSKRIILWGHHDINILFPTACPLSFALARKLENHEIRCKLFMRLTNTNENKGIFKVLNDKHVFVHDSQLFNFVECKFGFEMFEYSETFSKDIEISHSPLPTRIKPKVNATARNLACFLGSPQKHKGQHDLLKIVEGTLNSDAVQINWVVQTSEDSYDLFKAIKGHPERLQLEVGFVTDEKMSLVLTDSSLACLPYDIDRYTYNASAFAYLCADYSVAVATFNGSAFSKEIDRYEIGFTAPNAQLLCEKIISFFRNNNEQIYENISRYNSYRVKANLSFLNLETDSQYPISDSVL